MLQKTNRVSSRLDRKLSEDVRKAKRVRALSGLMPTQSRNIRSFRPPEYFTPKSLKK